MSGMTPPPLGPVTPFFSVIEVLVVDDSKAMRMIIKRNMEQANIPDLEILENRLTLWDGAEECAVFESGLAAITTVLFEFLRPGDVLLHSSPLYGGTDHFINKVLTQFGIRSLAFSARDTMQDVEALVERGGVRIGGEHRDPERDRRGSPDRGGTRGRAGGDDLGAVHAVGVGEYVDDGDVVEHDVRVRVTADIRGSSTQWESHWLCNRRCRCRTVCVCVCVYERERE